MDVNGNYASSSSAAAPAWLHLGEANAVLEEGVARTPTEQVTLYFCEHRASILRYVSAIGVRSEDREEIVQEVFLRLCRALERGERIEQVRGWLFRVARNLAIDNSRRRRYFVQVIDDVWQRLRDTVSDARPTSEQIVTREDLLAHMREAFDCLTTVQRHCLHLRAEGLRYREIADVMDMSVWGVADAVQRGLNRLRRHVAFHRDAQR